MSYVWNRKAGGLFSKSSAAEVAQRAMEEEIADEDKDCVLLECNEIYDMPNGYYIF